MREATAISTDPPPPGHRRGVLEALAARLRAGEVTPEVLLERAVERAGAPELDAVYLAIPVERARREAARSGARHRRGRSRGLLDGIPVAWKDVFDVGGTPTTAGSASRKRAAPATEDAEAVQRLGIAGMVCVGKTNLSEFAFSGLGINPHFGTPANPWAGNEALVPGGSSSGSAVAVSAGSVPVAIGTDTSGSVRVPAAFNALVGFKPSAGRYPQGGVYPLSRTLDRVGVLAPMVRDCVIVDQALRGRLPLSSHAPSVEGVEVVVPTNVLSWGTDAPVMEGFDNAVEALRARGVRVIRRPLRGLEQAYDVIAAHGTITAAEAYALHRDLLGRATESSIDPLVARRLKEGGAQTGSDLVAIQRVREQASRTLAHELGGALVLFPTVGCLPPSMNALASDPERAHNTNARVLRNCMVGSLLDLPGVALPCGLDARHGLPISCLLSAPAGQDVRVLASALGLEAAIAEAGLWRTPLSRYFPQELEK